MFSLLSVSLALAFTSVAKPLAHRQTSAICSGFGQFDTVEDFVFAASPVGDDTNQTFLPLYFTYAGKDAFSDTLYHLSVSMADSEI